MNDRVPLIVLPVLLVLLILAGLVYSLYAVDLVIDKTEIRGLADIRQIHGDITEASLREELTTADYQRIVKAQEEIISARIIIIDMDSRLLADSGRKPEEISGQFINAELSDAKRREYASSSIRDRNTGDYAVIVAQKKQAAGGEIVISVNYRIDEAKKLTAAFAVFAAAAVLITAWIVVLIVSLVLRQYQGPIRKLLKFTRDAARGGIYKINVDTSSSELAQLVENFNSLVDRYNLLTESDNRKYSRINTLLSNLKTGILMVDRESAITLVNPRAEEMLSLNKLRLFKVRETGAYRNGILEEILRETKRVNREKENTALSLTTPEGLILDISVEAVYSKYDPYEHTGALVILQDVTDMRRLEKLKDDFVANVSHELRTPLTLINGFVETLKSWEVLSAEDRNTALNIIELETERLKKLINELLLLSRIEGGMSAAAKNPIDPAGIVREVVAALEPFKEEKQITTEVDIREPVAPLSGVVSWYRQIVFNLYDNAVKYTPAGGGIRIGLRDGEQSLILTVSDTGIGIPAGEREKIFDRFYRIEKYRNRKISGSGLGLTITKHMVEEFGGAIDVVSEEGAGSTFRVIFPRTGPEKK